MEKKESAARLMGEVEASRYVGMGKTYFRQWAEEIGARRVLSPRMIRYDRTVIDAALDAMTKK